MTRERVFGWFGSLALQLLALGALGVSPYMSYDNLPEPANAIPLRNYVPTIEAVRAPVAAQKAPAANRTRPEAARILSSFVAPIALPEGIAEEISAFLEGDQLVESVPVGFEVGFPSSGTARETVEAHETPPEPVRVGGSVTAPRKRHHENPDYPPIAAIARIQGTVVLEATIDELGNVIDVRVLRSVPLLDQAAIDAVRRWKYEPTRLNGKPVPILMSVSVRFELAG